MVVEKTAMGVRGCKIILGLAEEGRWFSHIAFFVSGMTEVV
jgi:hypothetical protein